MANFATDKRTLYLFIFVERDLVTYVAIIFRLLDDEFCLAIDGVLGHDHFVHFQCLTGLSDLYGVEACGRLVARLHHG